MDLKEKMMDMMMGSMSAEDRRQMMDTMMEKFFSSMSPEEKQEMMKTMMPKMMEMMRSMMGGKGSMMGMMSGSAAEKAGVDAGGFNPMEMCSEMMSSMRRNSDLATFATPEIRGLFEEWVRQIEDEIEHFVSQGNTSDPESVASQFKISKESALYFLSRLAQKGKISINVSK